ncbi:hypothetical protein YPPY66_3001 [Yersinia pestis PY-66]|nr:hypothetical protein YPPY05_2728 [Yersinia pestis PY-05]EIR19653.1 hypothetical protein YPPY09_2789 [Yersinia pestis PY-09]EIR32722.1 hypothetical protein YPPY11_2873 [Yersinia pestis PY-11]EIR75898.1 hypothetical protein YPPY34_2758 [Yersinia pestis PY-34]EIR90125.1 hypothetical protein YPPY42_2788 [Yersinia pestis PY-42]EIS05334.1 hypothetical protein YPPY48_2791 [Yersinia pestis PY-48]EIS60259.1 hypothetical protein YPPY64_2826 [Yersinia pestis PY-64]EIS73415.1 hypothetical protein YPP
MFESVPTVSADGQLMRAKRELIVLDQILMSIPIAPPFN